MKTAFLLSTGTFWGDLFTKKRNILSLSDVVGELLDLFRKSICGVVKFCNYVSIERFRRKKRFFPRKKEVFQKRQRLRDYFSVIVEKFSTRLPKLDSIRTFPRKTLILRKVFFISILDIERNSLCLLLTFFRVGLSKSPSTCPLEHFEGFIFFHFAFFLFQFRTLIEKFHAILESTPTELSKLIPDACPRVNIGERNFNRNIVFFILFGQWAKSFRPFDKFFKAEF